MINRKINRALSFFWQSRTQILMALCAPETKMVALSELLMLAIMIHEFCRDIGLEIGPDPNVFFVVKIDNQVILI